MKATLARRILTPGRDKGRTAHAILTPRHYYEVLMYVCVCTWTFAFSRVYSTERNVVNVVGHRPRYIDVVSKVDKRRANSKHMFQRAHFIYATVLLKHEDAASAINISAILSTIFGIIHRGVFFNVPHVYTSETRCSFPPYLRSRIHVFLESARIRYNNKWISAR